MIDFSKEQLEFIYKFIYKKDIKDLISKNLFVDNKFIEVLKNKFNGILISIYKHYKYRQYCIVVTQEIDIKEIIQLNKKYELDLEVILIKDVKDFSMYTDFECVYNNKKQVFI